MTNFTYIFRGYKDVSSQKIQLRYKREERKSMHLMLVFFFFFFAVLFNSALFIYQSLWSIMEEQRQKHCLVYWTHFLHRAINKYLLILFVCLLVTLVGGTDISDPSCSGEAGGETIWLYKNVCIENRNHFLKSLL